MRRVVALNPAQVQLDALISWYQQNRPGRQIDIRVQFDHSACARFCTQTDDGLVYRGYRIIPADQTVQRADAGGGAAQ